MKTPHRNTQQEPDQTTPDPLGTPQAASPPDPHQKVPPKTAVHWNNWCTVYNENEIERLQAERFLKCLADRASYEETFGDGLISIADDMNKIRFSSEDIDSFRKSLIEEFRARGETSKQLAKHISSDLIEDTLFPTLNNHFEVQTKIYQDTNTFSKQLDIAKQQYNDSLGNMKETAIKAEFEITSFINNQTILTPADKTKLSKKLLRLACEAKEAKEKYITSLESYETGRESFRKQVKMVFPCLSDMNKKRRTCLMDCFQKLQIYQISSDRTNQYQIDTLLKQTKKSSSQEATNEAASIIIDFPELVQVSWTEVPARSTANKPSLSTEPSAIADAAFKWMSKTLPLERLLAGGTKLDNKSKGDSPTLTLHEEEKQEYKEAIRGIFAGLIIPSTIKKLHHIHDTMNSFQIRELVCDELLSLLEDESKAKLPSKNHFNTLAWLCSSLLDYSEQDEWAGRSVLVASQFFFFLGSCDDDPQLATLSPPELTEMSLGYEISDENKTTKWMLARALYHHSIWNKVLFWESCLMITASEYLQKELLSQRWKTLPESQAQFAEDAFRCRCRTSPRKLLESFGNIMFVFGIDTNEASQLFERITEKYGLGEDVCRFLLSSSAAHTEVVC